MNIFICGAYGVGKTTFSNQLSNLLGLPHHSASKIIGHRKKNKSIQNLGINQEALINGLEAINKVEKTLLLDGHFCVVERDELVMIPLVFFSKLNINRVIVLIDNPSSILDRLSSRDGSQFDIDTIKRIQDIELERANEFSSKYEVPIFIANASDLKFDEVCNFILKSKADLII